MVYIKNTIETLERRKLKKMYEEEERNLKPKVSFQDWLASLDTAKRKS